MNTPENFPTAEELAASFVGNRPMMIDVGALTAWMTSNHPRIQAAHTRTQVRTPHSAPSSPPAQNPPARVAATPKPSAEELELERRIAQLERPARPANDTHRRARNLARMEQAYGPKRP